MTMTMATPNPTHPLAQLLEEDRRYRFDAYLFVFESLQFAQKELGYGKEESSEGEAAAKRKPGESRRERHLTGQQLCEAIRLLALERYGLMAKCVLNSWGVHNTGDFGEIVFNLIRIGEMKKTKKDRREDFDNVFDFDEGLSGAYEIKLPEATD